MTEPGKVIKVLIGQVALTHAPNSLETVLGSCIGLVLYDPEERLAGMAHILLPTANGRDPGHLPGKYADLAVPCLYQGLLRYGALPQRLQAKMAGGAGMFQGPTNRERNEVGSANIAAVDRALRDLTIPLVAAQVGGQTGRKICFEPASGWLQITDFAHGQERI